MPSIIAECPVLVGTTAGAYNFGILEKGAAMFSRRVFFASLMAGAAALAAGSSAAQDRRGELAQPDYGSSVSTGFLSNTHFNTPEADGRPGVKFYAEGMAAYHRKDYAHAVYMLKVSASWAYKPAEYNLGVMYFQGEGVPVDRPLGTAWMFLAAERNTPAYVDARHMMVTSLDTAERAQAYALLQDMERTYGDEVALRRAKAQWGWVRTHQTGTHVGGTVGELRVGVSADSGSYHTPMGGSGGSSAAGTERHSWMQVLGGGSVDGDMAYQQMHQSDNPYDRVFLKNIGGTTSVGPLTTLDSDKTQTNKDKESKKPADGGLMWCNKDGCS